MAEHVYSPDALRILAHIHAGTYCRDCGVPKGDDHLELCPRYDMPNLEGLRVADYGIANRTATVVDDTGNHCVSVRWDAPYPYGERIQSVSRHRLTVIGGNA